MHTQNGPFTRPGSHLREHSERKRRTDASRGISWDSARRPRFSADVVAVQEIFTGHEVGGGVVVEPQVLIGDGVEA